MDVIDQDAMRSAVMSCAVVGDNRVVESEGRIELVWKQAVASAAPALLANLGKTRVRGALIATREHVCFH